VVGDLVGPADRAEEDRVVAADLRFQSSGIISPCFS
jgi:hypothetical protein